MAALEQSAHRPALISEWTNMLAHQLPALPPLEAFWEELADLFAWLEGTFTQAELTIAPVQSSGEAVDEEWMGHIVRTE